MSNSGRRSGRITLREVAERAGVSVQTASHVLAENMTVRLPEATRERVKQAARDLNYQPNRHAQAIRMGSTNVVAVWMPINRPTVSLLRLLQAVSENAARTGHELMIVGLDRVEALKREGRSPTTWPVDGVFAIESGKAVERWREDEQSLSTPTAILGLEQVPNGDSVSWALRAASHRTAKTMIERGRRRFCMVTPRWIFEEFPNEQRRRGLTEALSEAGLVPEFVQTEGETSGEAEKAMDAWLDAGGNPDAVFGLTDTYAIGAARAMLRRGLRIPSDVAVWGMGDYPEAADFTVPLSTLKYPIDAIVRQAWDWLVERMGGHAGEPRLVELELDFIERESTKFTAASL